jgi:hypothetical protein
LEQLRPIFSREYAAAARVYALDVALAVLLFVCTSVMTGRIWRFPFDDELITLAPIERTHSWLQLLVHYLNAGDIHPPLSFLLFYGLTQAGLSEAQLRLCSLAMTALALALFHLLALALAAQRGNEHVSFPTRLTAVLLFGFCALAISQGDAIRWYPPFTILIALFVVLYLAGANGAVQLVSAVPLGLAASTNFLAVLVAAPFVIYRYWLQRRFQAAYDLAYWLVVGLFSGLGLYSFYSILAHRLANVAHTEFGGGTLRAVMTDMLGFFGGDALGISQSWIVVPVVAISAMAVLSLIDRRQPANPIHLLLMMLAASLLFALTGFGKPRSFLYLTPVLAAVLTLFLNRQATDRNAASAVCLVSLILAASVASIANINFGTHPFKRNAVIPYQDIVDFIQTNETGSTLIVSTDSVIPWVLRHQYQRDDSCVSYFLWPDGCPIATQRYDSIFVIAGHSDKSAAARVMTRFNTALQTVTADRQKIATIHVGVDKDASLKSRLTGVALDEYILTVDLYR